MKDEVPRPERVGGGSMKHRRTPGAAVCFVVAAAALALLRSVVPHGSGAAGLAFTQQLANAHAARPTPSPKAEAPKLAAITVDYPDDGSLFPPEITPPTFLWRDVSPSASAWTIDVAFTDGAATARMRALVHLAAVRFGVPKHA